MNKQNKREDRAIPWDHNATLVQAHMVISASKKLFQLIKVSG